MASTKGLEPLTVRLEGVCSIQLSYVDVTLKYSIIKAQIFQVQMRPKCARALYTPLSSTSVVT